jgi:hypothetical protein
MHATKLEKNPGAENVKMATLALAGTHFDTRTELK